MSPRGFTLLELMLVLAIVGIAVVGVVRSLPDGAARELTQDGDRLAAILNAARAQARTQGIHIVLRLEGDAAALPSSDFLSSDLPASDLRPSALWFKAQLAPVWAARLAVPQAGENQQGPEPFAALSGPKAWPPTALQAAAGASAQTTTLAQTAGHWTGADMPLIAAHEQGVRLPWLHASTRASIGAKEGAAPTALDAATLTLSPNPVDAPQVIVLTHADGRWRLVVSSDGAADFTAGPLTALSQP